MKRLTVGISVGGIAYLTVDVLLRLETTTGGYQSINVFVRSRCNNRLIKRRQRKGFFFGGGEDHLVIKKGILDRKKEVNTMHNDIEKVTPKKITLKTRYSS